MLVENQERLVVDGGGIDEGQRNEVKYRRIEELFVGNTMVIVCRKVYLLFFL